MERGRGRKACASIEQSRNRANLSTETELIVENERKMMRAQKARQEKNWSCVEKWTSPLSRATSVSIVVLHGLDLNIIPIITPTRAQPRAPSRGKRTEAIKREKRKRARKHLFRSLYPIPVDQRCAR